MITQGEFQPGIIVIGIWKLEWMIEFTAELFPVNTHD